MNAKHQAHAPEANGIRDPQLPALRAAMSRALLLTAVIVGTIVGIGVTGQPAGATTRLPDLQCGVNPTTDVRLRADLTCDTGFAGDADHTGAPLVNIDLGGHTLTVTNGTCSFFGRCGAIFNEASVSNGKVVGDLKNVRRVSFVRVTGSVYLNENTPDPAVLEASTVRGGRVGILGPNSTVRFSTPVGRWRRRRRHPVPRRVLRAGEHSDHRQPHQRRPRPPASTWSTPAEAAWPRCRASSPFNLILARR